MVKYIHFEYFLTNVVQKPEGLLSDAVESESFYFSLALTPVLSKLCKGMFNFHRVI